MIVRVERRHPVTADRFADHRRERLDLLVVCHVPRRDAVRLVAVDALIHQDRHDVVGIGDLGELSFLAAIGEDKLRALAGHHLSGGRNLARNNV